MPTWCHPDGRPYSNCVRAFKPLACGICATCGLSAEMGQLTMRRRQSQGVEGMNVELVLVK